LATVLPLVHGLSITSANLWIKNDRYIERGLCHMTPNLVAVATTVHLASAIAAMVFSQLTVSSSALWTPQG